MSYRPTLGCLALGLCVACGSAEPAPGTPATGGSAGSAATPIAGAGGGSSGAGSAGSSAALAGAGGGSVGGSAGAAVGGGGAASGGSSGAAALGGTGQGGGGGQAGGDSPPEGVPATYHLVYRQSFADPSSMNDLVFGNPTQWHHDPAGFIASTGTSYAPMYRSPFSVAMIKSFKVKSFVMDAEMLQTSPDGDGHRDMVFIWDFVSPTQFYYAHISTAHDGVAHNIHIVNNADRTAISDTFTPGYDWGRDVWKKLRVVRDAADGSMAVYDREALATPLLTANDTTFLEGYLGFGSFDNTGQVRNVEVWADVSTPAPANFFAPAE